MKLSETGEFGLIELFKKSFSALPGTVVKGIGDDAAVLKTNSGKWLLFTTDMLVEGVHFSLAYATFQDIGYKALAVNVSDIAAMGGQPAWALVSIALLPEMLVENVVALYGGLKEAGQQFGVSIIGGDTVRCPERLVINIALLGEVEEGLVVFREGARIGDLICVTGTLGASAAGIYLLQNPEVSCKEEVAAFVKAAHLKPVPRVEAGRALASLRVSAMDDISDGLANELHEICKASGVGCRLAAGDVPVADKVRELADLIGCDPLDWALYGGEDFELVFTVNKENFLKAKQALAELGIKCTRIGEIVPREEKLSLCFPDGQIAPLYRGGYDHFV